MAHHADPFAPSVETARAWLAAVIEGLGTTDHAFGYRVTRAWLHAVRDRLDPTAATHLAAQLPEVWRGAFFSGWRPGPAPSRPKVSAFVEQFATEAGIEKTEVPEILGSITTTLDSLFSQGQLDHAMANLPAALVGLLWGETPPERDAAEDALSATLHTSFDDAVERTRMALLQQGFGVLTEIDVRATMRAKLGVDMEDYLILGACNPPLANRALETERRLGLLLPCNVVVRAVAPDSVLVEAADPGMMASLVGTPAITEVADEATGRVRAAMASLVSGGARQ